MPIPEGREESEEKAKSDSVDRDRMSEEATNVKVAYKQVMRSREEIIAHELAH